jgi:uncharacterized membrane protein YeiH
MRRLLLLIPVLSLLPAAVFYAVATVIAHAKIDLLGALPFLAFACTAALVGGHLRRALMGLNVPKAFCWSVVLTFVLFWVPFLSWTLMKIVCMQFMNECL